jgi:hypothetical protein
MPATFTGWPPGMRIIARRERLHPGAQLRLTDHEGLAHHHVRHQHPWRTTGRPGGPPPAAGPSRGPHPRAQRHWADQLACQAFAKNQIWLEPVQLAAELLTWTQLLAWHDKPARTWEPKRLRLQLLTVAGRIITTDHKRLAAMT